VPAGYALGYAPSEHRRGHGESCVKLGLRQAWNARCQSGHSAMKRAAAAQTTGPARANELWTEVDHALVDRAVLVPTVSPRYPVFVSDRVGNYQSHPLWGTLLDQLWVK
jgi:hypothetical protein